MATIPCRSLGAIRTCRNVGCQAGQIMQAESLLKENPSRSDDDIIKAMSGNICRCGCYQRIVSAVSEAATGA